MKKKIIRNKYKLFKVPYREKDNNNYLENDNFCCGDKKSSKGDGITDNEDPELNQFYYHSDHLGSSSYITNLKGSIVQHIEYIPFGEVFIEERNNKWNTPYLFNGKELDEETGLYYYGARYYSSRNSIFLSVDRFAEKYPGVSPYQYCLNNPINALEINGDSIWYTQKGDIITMHLSAKILNKSGENINMERASNDIESSIDKSFSGIFEVNRNNYRLELNANISIANNMDDISDSDHLFVLAKGTGKGARGATNQIGGKVITIASSDYSNDNIFSNNFTSNNTRTATHEFGHVLGLRHESASGKFNLMTQGGMGRKITSKQRNIIIRQANNINRGSNSYYGQPYPYIHGYNYFTKKTETLHISKVGLNFK